MFAVHGHGLELGTIGEALERQQPRAGVGRVPRDTAEQAGVGQLSHGRVPHRLGRGRAGQARQILVPAERAEGAHRRGGATRLSRKRDDALHGGIPHAGVAVVARHGGQHVRIRQLAHGRPAHARIRIFGGHLDEHVGLGGVEGLNGLETHHRIAVFPSGLGAELVENTHAYKSGLSQSLVSGAEPPSVLHGFGRRARPIVRGRFFQSPAGLGKHPRLTYHHQWMHRYA